MSKKVVWAMVRAGVIYLLMPLFVGILITLSASPMPLYVNLHPEAVTGTTAFILCISWFLMQKLQYKALGKLLLVSLPAVVLLALVHQSYVSFLDGHFTAHTLILLIVLLIAALYFVVPVKQIKTFLALIPVVAMSWFMLYALYKPTNLVYEVAVSRDQLNAEQYQQLIELLPHLCLSSLKTSVLACGFILIYCLSLYGNNPVKTYECVKTRFNSKTQR